MIDFRKPSATAALVCGTWIAKAVDAGAVDLNGAWAASADQCDKGAHGPA